MDLDTSALVAKVNSQSLLSKLDTDPNINYIESDNISIQSADGDAFEHDSNYLDQEDYVIESPEACLSNNICAASPSCPDSTVEISSDLNLAKAKLNGTDQTDYFDDCDFKTSSYFKSHECNVDSSSIGEKHCHQLLFEKEVTNREDVLNYQQIISNASPTSSADFISPESILETSSELLDVPDKSDLSALEFSDYLLSKDIEPHFIVGNYSNCNEKVKHNLNENNIDTGDMGIENAWNEGFSVPSTSSYPQPLTAPLENNIFSYCNNFDEVEHGSYTSDLEALFSTNEADSDVADPIADEGVCGLRNLGNTCFMSAGLQCLAATVSLVRYFNVKLSLNDLDENSLTLQFTELIQKMWSARYSVVHPMKFKQALGACYPQFKDCRQHDCQEFLALLLDALHQQLVALPKSASGEENAFKEKMDVSMDYLSSSADAPAKNLNDFMNNNNNNSNNNSNNNFNNNNEVIASADSTSSTGDNLDYARMDVHGDMFSPKHDDNGNEAVACDSTGNHCDEKSNYMDDIFKEAKTSNINVLVTESGANNEICFDSEKFPKKERRRNISKTNNCDTYPNLTNSLQKNSDSFCVSETGFGDNLDLKRIKVNHLNKEKNCLRKNEKNSNKPLEKNVRIENERKMKVQNVRSNVNKKNNMDIEDDRDVICLDNEAQPLKIQIHNVHTVRSENAMETDVVDGGLEVQSDDEETASSMSEDLLTDDVMAEAKLTDKNIFNNKNLALDSCKTQLKNTNKRKMKELNKRAKTTRENVMETEDDRDVAESVTEPATDEDATNSSMSEEDFQTDDIEAEKHWENHIYNNRSVIFDSFQGQFKNTVVCSTCNYRSVTYEPFMYLSVPLPHAIEKQLCVTFISANANPPVQYLITLTKQDEVSKIKHHLTKVVSDEIKHPVVVGEVFDHHIAKILDDNHQIRYLDDVNRSIYAFEQTCVLPKDRSEMESSDNLSGSGDNEAVSSMSASCTICLEEKESDIKRHKDCECVLCDVCIQNYKQHQGEKSIKCPVCRQDMIPERDLVPIEQRDMKPNTRLLNVPLVYRVDKMADGNNNQKSVTLFGHPALLRLPNQITGAELYEVVAVLHPYKEPFKLLLVDGQGRHCSRCMYNQHCKGCTVSQDSHIFSLRTDDTLAVTFSDEVQEVCEIRDPSMTFQREYKTLTLYDCVQAFSQSEILDEFNPWFCPRCEKNQCATKTLSVWRYPNYLIVYLKRFVFHECNSIKLDDKVMFPLHDFILNSKKSSSYDLYACVCHTGGVSVGHYIAYTRHPVTNEWHCFNDENVSKQKPPEEEYCNAYILFYKKKDIPDDEN